MELKASRLYFIFFFNFSLAIFVFYTVENVLRVHLNYIIVSLRCHFPRRLLVFQFAFIFSRQVYYFLFCLGTRLTIYHHPATTCLQVLRVPSELTVIAFHHGSCTGVRSCSSFIELAVHIFYVIYYTLDPSTPDRAGVLEHSINPSARWHVWLGFSEGTRQKVLTPTNLP